jgi:hypothetical protein
MKTPKPTKLFDVCLMQQIDGQPSLLSPNYAVRWHSTEHRGIPIALAKFRLKVLVPAKGYFGIFVPHGTKNPVDWMVEQKKKREERKKLKTKKL